MLKLQQEAVPFEDRPQLRPSVITHPDGLFMKLFGSRVPPDTSVLASSVYVESGELKERIPATSPIQPSSSRFVSLKNVYYEYYDQHDLKSLKRLPEHKLFDDPGEVLLSDSDSGSDILEVSLTHKSRETLEKYSRSPSKTVPPEVKRTVKTIKTSVPARTSAREKLVSASMDDSDDESSSSSDRSRSPRQSPSTQSKDSQPKWDPTEKNPESKGGPGDEDNPTSASPEIMITEEINQEQELIEEEERVINGNENEASEGEKGSVLKQQQCDIAPSETETLETQNDDQDFEEIPEGSMSGRVDNESSLFKFTPPEYGPQGKDRPGCYYSEICEETYEFLPNEDEGEADQQLFETDSVDIPFKHIRRCNIDECLDLNVLNDVYPYIPKRDDQLLVDKVPSEDFLYELKPKVRLIQETASEKFQAAKPPHLIGYEARKAANLLVSINKKEEVNNHTLNGPKEIVDFFCDHFEDRLGEYDGSAKPIYSGAEPSDRLLEFVEELRQKQLNGNPDKPDAAAKIDVYVRNYDETLDYRGTALTRKEKYSEAQKCHPFNNTCSCQCEPPLNQTDEHAHHFGESPLPAITTKSSPYLDFKGDEEDKWRLVVVNGRLTNKLRHFLKDLVVAGELKVPFVQPCTLEDVKQEPKFDAMGKFSHPNFNQLFATATHLKIALPVKMSMDGRLVMYLERFGHSLDFPSFIGDADIELPTLSMDVLQAELLKECYDRVDGLHSIIAMRQFRYKIAAADPNKMVVQVLQKPNLSYYILYSPKLEPDSLRPREFYLLDPKLESDRIPEEALLYATAITKSLVPESGIFLTTRAFPQIPKQKDSCASAVFCLFAVSLLCSEHEIDPLTIDPLKDNDRTVGSLRAKMKHIIVNGGQLTTLAKEPGLRENKIKQVSMRGSHITKRLKTIVDQRFFVPSCCVASCRMPPFANGRILFDCSRCQGTFHENCVGTDGLWDIENPVRFDKRTIAVDRDRIRVDDGSNWSSCSALIPVPHVTEYKHKSIVYTCEECWEADYYNDDSVFSDFNFAEKLSNVDLQNSDTQPWTANDLVCLLANCVDTRTSANTVVADQMIERMVSQVEGSGISSLTFAHSTGLLDSDGLIDLRVVPVANTFMNLCITVENYLSNLEHRVCRLFIPLMCGNSALLAIITVGERHWEVLVHNPLIKEENYQRHVQLAANCSYSVRGVCEGVIYNRGKSITCDSLIPFRTNNCSREAVTAIIVILQIYYGLIKQKVPYSGEVNAAKGVMTLLRSFLCSNFIYPTESEFNIDKLKVVEQREPNIETGSQEKWMPMKKAILEMFEY